MQKKIIQNKINIIKNESDYTDSNKEKDLMSKTARSKFFENEVLQNEENTKKSSMSEIYSENDEGQRKSNTSSNLIASSKNLSITIFNQSINLDAKILKELFFILSNDILEKENETEYYDDFDIFDQEWNFPHNQNFFEFQDLVEKTETNASPENKIEMYQKNLVDLQIQLRTLSHYFIKVDNERTFFRDKLVKILQMKVEEAVTNSVELKQFVNTHFENKSEKFDIKLKRLEAENETLKKSLKEIEEKNLKIMGEVKVLTENLNEKRKELKNYRFNRDNKEDPNITGTTTNSNNGQKSGDNSYLSRDYINKLTIKPKTKINNIQSQRYIKHNSNFVISKINESDGTLNIYIFLTQ